MHTLEAEQFLDGTGLARVLGVLVELDDVVTGDVTCIGHRDARGDRSQRCDRPLLEFEIAVLEVSVGEAVAERVQRFAVAVDVLLVGGVGLAAVVDRLLADGFGNRHRQVPARVVLAEQHVRDSIPTLLTWQPGVQQGRDSLGNVRDRVGFAADLNDDEWRVSFGETVEQFFLDARQPEVRDVAVLAAGRDVGECSRVLTVALVWSLETRIYKLFNIFNYNMWWTFQLEQFAPCGVASHGHRSNATRSIRYPTEQSCEPLGVGYSAGTPLEISLPTESGVVPGKLVVETGARPS